MTSIAVVEQPRVRTLLPNEAVVAETLAIVPVRRLALSGKAGSGKTTLAKRLAADHGFQRMGFAGRLKEELATLLGIGLAEFEAKKAHWRPLMQEWGSARRDVSEAYWVRKLLVRLPFDRGSPVVIDDLRYENEARALKREGFVLVRLDCPSLDSIRYLRTSMSMEAADLASQHASERDLDDYDGFDFIIDAPRSRSLDDIYAELKEALGW